MPTNGFKAVTLKEKAYQVARNAADKREMPVSQFVEEAIEAYAGACQRIDVLARAFARALDQQGSAGKLVGSIDTPSPPR